MAATFVLHGWWRTF
ncbi:trp operon leader peptide [Salmonella enterica subsp. houtenae]|nr:trp operon leader peptide [Salmonella enterica subsp. houtenae]